MSARNMAITWRSSSTAISCWPLTAVLPLIREDETSYRSAPPPNRQTGGRSEEHTSELQSLMRISYAVFCLKKKITTYLPTITYMSFHTTSLLLSHIQHHSNISHSSYD